MHILNIVTTIKKKDQISIDELEKKITHSKYLAKNAGSCKVINADILKNLLTSRIEVRFKFQTFNNNMDEAEKKVKETVYGLFKEIGINQEHLIVDDAVFDLD